MADTPTTKASRREFMTTAGTGIVSTSVLAGFPAIVPASVFSANAPGNRINVGAIGTGRISRGHDMPGIWKHDNARIVAVCDLDSRRLQDARTLVNGYYTKKTGKPYDGVTAYDDYRELLANKDVDAVVISTPDHWHARIAIHAVEAGKDVYLQKPASLTIAEGRTLSNAVHRSGRIFQIGSQQRSSPQFRYAAELVRNGRIGQLKSVEVGLPGDPSGDEEPAMPVPKNLNYDVWLGSTPSVPYTEKRVHPQTGYDRPGWLRCEQFGAGMITGWGAHHIDSAHWAMGMEFTGPVEVWGSAEFPSKGLWDVHGPFRTEALYADGVRMGVRLPRQSDGDRERPGIEAERRPGAGLQRSGDHHVGHRAGRSPLVREQGSSRELAGVREIARAADHPRGSRAPGLLGLFDPSHRHEGEAEAVLGSGQGALQERRRGECDAVAASTAALWH
jgi:predicted dehydrogenase